MADSLPCAASSLAIAPGECVVLAGRNGSGKTTLLRVAARLVRPSNGTLTFASAAAQEEDSAVRPGFIAHATMVYDELTAEENLLLFARLLGVAPAQDRVDALLDEVGLVGSPRLARAYFFSRYAPARGHRPRFAT